MKVDGLTNDEVKSHLQVSIYDLFSQSFVIYNYPSCNFLMIYVISYAFAEI
jgi:hypothetical protein